MFDKHGRNLDKLDPFMNTITISNTNSNNDVNNIKSGAVQSNANVSNHVTSSLGQLKQKRIKGVRINVR